MRVLVGKTFGIGNACLSIPMIKALRLAGHRVDVLIGSTPDDFGALDVFTYFAEHHPLSIGQIYIDQVPGEIVHDLAIMSIPYDGRWQRGIHYRTLYDTMDERRRPGNVDRLGFDMWEKHEVEYQMENARALGYDGPTPSGEVEEIISGSDPDLVYLGIGYKRDPGGFGRSKHFGTERYFQLMQAIRKIRPGTRFFSTCSVGDWIQVGVPLQKRCFESNPMAGTFYTCKHSSVQEAIMIARGCSAYLGNDTGMMHVSAALGRRTFGLFAYKDLLVKNPPYTSRGRALLFGPDAPSIDEIADEFVSFTWG